MTLIENCLKIFEIIDKQIFDTEEEMSECIKMKVFK